MMTPPAAVVVWKEPPSPHVQTCPDVAELAEFHDSVTTAWMVFAGEASTFQVTLDPRKWVACRLVAPSTRLAASVRRVLTVRRACCEASDVVEPAVCRLGWALRSSLVNMWFMVVFVLFCG